MKKIAFFLLAAVPFFSCNWFDSELPKSVGVKTSAKYEFSLGTFSGNLSEYLSVQTLTESLGGSDSNVDFKIYDYYPAYSDEKALQKQQFLIDFPIKTVTLDINDYLKEMDFSTALEEMSFAPDVIDLKDFKIKDIDPISVKPDINKKIEESTNRMKCNITIPKTGGEKGFSSNVLNSMTATIDITSPTFTTMQFYEARIDFTATPENYDDEEGFSTNLTLGLFNKGEKEPIDTIKNVDLTTKHTFSFLLNGKTITQNMEIKVISGSAKSSYGNGSPSITYNLVSELKNVKVQKVTDLTIEDPISVPIGGDTGTHITIDIGKSPKCEIGEGSIDIIAKQNETWKNWKGVTIEPKITLEGEITAAPKDFKKDEREGGDEYFIYRTKSLNGVTYHNGRDIIVKGAVDVKIQNADIQFAEDEDDTIIVEPTCNITKISKLWLDLSDDDALDGYDEEEELGSEITKYITAFGIDEKDSKYKNLFELKVDYINTLPEGNDIDLTVTSNYFEIDNDKRTLKAGTTNKIEPIVSPETLKEKKISDDNKIDFNVKWQIPGRGQDPNPAYSKCAILKNLKIGETYELKVTVTPVFNWDYVEINANGITEEGVVSTGLNFNSMFESFEDKLVGADGTRIINELKLIRMPLYFYCIMPLKGGVDLQGKIAVGTGDIEDGKAIWDDSTANPTPVVGKEERGMIEYDELKTKASLPKLEFNKGTDGADSDDETKMIIKEITKDIKDPAYVAPVDIADLFNLHSGSNIIFEYGMKLGGGEGKPIKLSKLELTESENSEPAKIQFHARIIVPLEIEAENDINLSFTKLLLNKEEGKDLFNRDEATSNDTIEDIISYLEYAQINAYFPKSPSVIQYFSPETNVEATEKNIRVEIYPNIDGIKEPYKLDLGENKPFEIYGDDFSKMLGECPFSPDIQFVIPAGCFYIRHNFEYDLKMELGAKFNDEEILIFGDKK